MQLIWGNKKVIGAIILAGMFAALVWYLYGSTVTKEETARVEIANCSSIEPAFISIQQSKQVYLVNRDSKEHIIKIVDGEIRLGAGEEKALSAEFIYGAGTYAYDCDSVVNAGQIQIEAPEKDLKGAKQQTFKEMYDSLPKELQDCVKKLLSSEFEKVYNGQEEFVLGPNDQETMNSCLESSQQTPRQ